MTDILIWTAIILLGFPAVIYLSVKMGTIGFYMGRQHFQKDQKQEKQNGET